MTTTIHTHRMTLDEMWDRVSQAAGPRAVIRPWEYQDVFELVIDQLDPARFPVAGEPDDSAHIAQSKRDARWNTLTVRTCHRRHAFTLALSALTFVPVGAELRSIPTGGAR